jgi:hypothetical protein
VEGKVRECGGSLKRGRTATGQELLKNAGYVTENGLVCRRRVGGYERGGVEMKRGEAELGEENSIRGGERCLCE